MQINTLANISVDVLQELCQQVIKSLKGEEIDYEKIKELSQGASLDSTELKACLSALTLIMRSGACHGVSYSELSTELEQLGLHRSHASALTKVYVQHFDSLVSILKEKSLRITRLESPVKLGPGPEQGTLRLSMTVKDASLDDKKHHSMVMTKQQAAVLLSELKNVKLRMDELQGE